MSAVPGGIGPVSVRYAAQIKNLLETQAVDRMIADQEAAVRAATEAEKATRVEAVEAPSDAVKVDVGTGEQKSAPIPVFKAAPEPAEPAIATLIDLQA